jgi:hypothetical protein
MAYLVSEYKLTFYKNKKVVGEFHVAARDSLVAENIGRKMADENTYIKASLVKTK